MVLKNGQKNVVAELSPVSESFKKKKKKVKQFKSIKSQMCTMILTEKETDEPEQKTKQETCPGKQSILESLGRNEN